MLGWRPVSAMSTPSTPQPCTQETLGVILYFQWVYLQRMNLAAGGGDHDAGEEDGAGLRLVRTNQSARCGHVTALRQSQFTCSHSWLARLHSGLMSGHRGAASPAECVQPPHGELGL